MKLTREETKELIKLIKEFVPIKLKDFYKEVGVTKQAVQKMGEGVYCMQFAVANRVTKGAEQYIEQREKEIAEKKVEIRNKLKKLSELKAYVERFNNN